MARQVSLKAIEGAIRSPKTPIHLKEGLIRKYGKQLGMPHRLVRHGETGKRDARDSYGKKKRRANPVSTWRTYTYDVWGNSKEGYEVNDVFRTDETVEIDTDSFTNDPGDKRLIKFLKKEGVIKSSAKANLIEIDGDEDTLYFDYKGRPEFELRREG